MLQIRCLAPFIAPSSYFESDGVHLNSAAGVEFVKYIVSSVDQVFPVLQCPTMTSPTSCPASEVNLLSQSRTLPPSDIESLSSAISDLTALTQQYHDEAITRRCQDNLVFARLKEDRDFELNKARENRFTLSGLKLKGHQVPPQDPADRKEFFKDLIKALIDEACPDADPKPQVLDVYVNMRRGEGAPFFEVKTDSASSSTTFRTAASKLSRGEHASPTFKGLFIANAVTLSTRVRIEILRALSKVLSSDTLNVFVKGFTSRPVMLSKFREQEDTDMQDVPPHASSGPLARSQEVYPPVVIGRSYTFCEAVEKWGHVLDDSSLASAYRKARPAFNGCLEQYFVVLKEHQDDEAGDIFDLLARPSGSNSQPIGVRGGSRGRPRGGLPGRGQRSHPRGGSWRTASHQGRVSGFPSVKRPSADAAGTPSKFRK